MGKVFRDPIHNLITFDGPEQEILLALVGTAEFQRLRRIRQMGVSSLTFHGAEHSRFTHSLGAYCVAKRMLESLERHREFEELFTPLGEKRKEILIGALLHDIGHAPFSHLLEKTFVPQNASADYPKNHEGWTVKIINGIFSNERLGGEVDWQFVCSLYGKSGVDNEIARDIISSQLDADRLDYLLRDSYAAGVPYGRFDLDWLIHSIRIGRVKLLGVAGQRPRLCFSTPKARAVVEQYVQARQSMYVQVYMHKTTRAYEALMRHVLGLAQHITQNNGILPGNTPGALIKVLTREALSLQEYLSLDDLVVWSALREWATARNSTDPALSLLARKCETLLSRGRPYRAIEIDAEDGMFVAIVEVNSQLKNENGLEQFSCYLDTYEDVPYRNVFYAKGKEEEEERVKPIYLLDRDGRTHLAEEDSRLIRAVSEIRCRVYRLYYDDGNPELVDLLKSKDLLRETST